MSEFTSFFIAAAGAAAALVGLLFVAVSISPERTVGSGATPERQAVAEGAFTALTNAFFISLAALIPGDSIGWVALIVGAVSARHSLATGWRALRSKDGFLMLVRQLFYVATTLVVYGLECAFGVQILGVLSRPQPDTIYSLAYVLLAVVAIGLSRAWQLLGAPHRGFLAWLSPLQPEGTPTNALPVRSASSQKNEKATN